MTCGKASGTADSEDTSNITSGARSEVVLGGGMMEAAAVNSGGNRRSTGGAAATTSSFALNDDSIGSQRDQLIGKQPVQLLSINKSDRLTPLMCLDSFIMFLLHHYQVTPFLQSLNVLINTDVKIAICTTCKSGLLLNVDSIHNHIREKHAHLSRGYRRKELQEELTKLALTLYQNEDSWQAACNPNYRPPFRRLLVPHVQGLPIHPNGFSCGECNLLSDLDGGYYCRTEGTMAQHFKNAHKGKTVSFARVPVQFLLSRNKKYFGVMYGMTHVDGSVGSGEKVSSSNNPSNANSHGGQYERRTAADAAVQLEIEKQIERVRSPDRLPTSVATGRRNAFHAYLEWDKVREWCNLTVPQLIALKGLPKRLFQEVLATSEESSFDDLSDDLDIEEEVDDEEIDDDDEGAADFDFADNAAFQAPLEDESLCFGEEALLARELYGEELTVTVDDETIQALALLIYLYLGRAKSEVRPMSLTDKLLVMPPSPKRPYSGLQRAKSYLEYSMWYCRFLVVLIRSICCAEYRGLRKMDNSENLLRICASLVGHLQTTVHGYLVQHQQPRSSGGGGTTRISNTPGLLGVFSRNGQAFSLLHRLNVAVWCHHISVQARAKERYVSPVARVLSFICTSNSGSPLKASLVKQVTAKLQFVCRTTVLLEALYRMRRADQEYAKVFDFCREGERTPYSQVHEVFVLSDTLAKDEFMEPNMDWVPHTMKNAVDVQGQHLALDDLRRIIGRLLVNAEEVLKQDVLRGHRPADESLLLTLKDDFMNEEPGFSFLLDKDNAEFRDASESALGKHLVESYKSLEGNRWLFRKVDNNSTTAEKEYQWNPIELGIWMAKVEKFLLMLISLIHLTGGQPARASELRELLIMNALGSHRNVFLCQNTFMLVQRYTKTSSMTGHDAAIARFLPKPVSMLLLTYLCMVKPFERLAASVLYGNRDASRVHGSYLFVTRGRQMTADAIRRVLRGSFSQAELKISFGQYRHVATAFSRAHLGVNAFEVAQASPQATSIEDGQRGHSSRTANAIYARMGGSYFPNLGTDQRERYHRCSLAWHELVMPRQDESPAPPCVRAPLSSRMMSDTSGRYQQIEGVTACEGGVPHKIPIRGIIQKTVNVYPRHFQFPTAVRLIPETSMSLPHSVAEALQKFLTPGSSEEPTSPPRFKSPLQAYAVAQVMDSKSGDLLVILPTGGGKSLIFMLPAFIEAARKEKARTTVVIVPLLALKADLKRRCDELGLDCAQWDGNSDKRTDRNPPSLVLVSPEDAVKERFTSFLTQLSSQERLSRIVFDEAHLFLTSSHYRPTMQKLRITVMRFNCPILALTATLPESMEKSVFTYFGRYLSVIRGDTTRRNIAYSVVLVKHFNDIIDRVISLAVDCLRDLESSDDRVIVFCPRVATVNEVYERLLVVMETAEEQGGVRVRPYKFFGQMSPNEKVESFKDWKESVGGIMVATSAFGAGVDFAKVRFVIHYGHSHSMIDYAQESGRVGRDGKYAGATVVTNQEYLENQVKFYRDKGETVALDNALAFKSFVENSRICMRQQLQIQMDGTGSSCLLDACVSHHQVVALCWVCQNSRSKSPAASTAATVSIPASNGTAAAIAAQKKRKISECPSEGSYEVMSVATQRRLNNGSHYVDRLKTYLQSFIINCSSSTSFCSICFALGKEGLGTEHYLESCPILCNQLGPGKLICVRCITSGHTYHECSVKNRFQQKGFCYVCTLPQCDGEKEHFHRRSGAFGNRNLCDSGGEDTILPLCWFVHRLGYKFYDVEAFLRHFGFEMSGMPSTDEYERWLTQNNDTYEQLVNATCVFVWCMDHRDQALKKLLHYEMAD